MGDLWYWIVCGMLGAYVVLDGFDLGVGIVLFFVGRNPEERRQAISAIGPVWDGNEVWLLAAGGTLFFAFPLLYASSFSGFYLPLMIVLWLLIGRGLAIELRGHVADPLARSFCDGLLCCSSALLAVFFGAALANVIRGVPIGEDGYFFLPLWTDWRTGPSPGILDWYTTIGGATAVLALALHGALYLAVKTEGPIEARALLLARRLWPVVGGATLLAVPATMVARPSSLRHYAEHPAAFVAPVAVVLGLAVLAAALRRGRVLVAFLASSVYLFAMFLGAAAGLYPALLPSSADPRRDLTLERALVGPYAQHVGLVWWLAGMAMAGIYFGVIYWLFRGKVAKHDDHYGH